MTIGYLTGRGKRASVGALALLATVAATALAAGGNSVQVRPPSNAQVNTHYTIRISGHARGTKTLYMFVDYKGCAQTPAGEHMRANGDIWIVSGNFTESSKGWKSPLAGSDHVCAYLVKKSEPKNPDSGVVAHDFVTYTIHH
jgi:hypothetical protein